MPPQCGECKKKKIECVMPTAGEETISRSEMQKGVAERQQRELRAQGLVEVDVSEAIEEEDRNDDDVDMGGIGEAGRRSEHNVARPTSAMQEEDLFASGACQKPSSHPFRAPSRGDGELSGVDPADLVIQSVTRRQARDQLVRKRKRTPEGESIRRNVVKVAKTAEDVGAAPVEQDEDVPVELALGEAGILTVTDDTIVEQHGADIEGVDTDDDILPETESIFDATSRLFRDHDSSLQATDRTAHDTTTQLDMNWNPQTPRRPDGSYNPIISADAADTFLLLERGTSLEELDANEAEVGDESAQPGAGVMDSDAGQDFDEVFAAPISAELLRRDNTRDAHNGAGGRGGIDLRTPALRSEGEPVVLQNLAEGQNAADDDMSIQYNSNGDWLSPNGNRGWRYEKKP